MPIRSQIDTSIYGNYNKNGNIGDLMNFAQGAMTIGNFIGQRRKQKVEDEKVNKINSAYSNAMNGWDGNNIDDYNTRMSNVQNEVSKIDPYKANEMFQNRQNFNAGVQKTASEIDKEKSIVRQNDAQVAKLKKEEEKGEIERQIAEFGYKGKQAEVIYNNLKDVKDQSTLDGAYTRLTAQGIPLTDAYKDYNVFATNKDKLFDSTKAQRDEANRLVEEADKKLKSKKSEADLQGTYLDNKKKQYDLDNPKIDEGKILTESGNTSIQQATIAANTAVKLKNKLDEISQFKKGPIVGGLFGKNPYDTDFQEVENYVNMLVPSLSRGVFKEVGVLTESDVKRYKNMIADARKDPKVASQIMDNLLGQIDETYKTYLNTYKKSGYNLSGYDKYNSVYDIVNEVSNKGVTKSKYNILEVK